MNSDDLVNIILGLKNKEVSSETQLSILRNMEIEEIDISIKVLLYCYYAELYWNISCDSEFLEACDTAKSHMSALVTNDYITEYYKSTLLLQAEYYTVNEQIDKTKEVIDQLIITLQNKEAPLTEFYEVHEKHLDFIDLYKSIQVSRHRLMWNRLSDIERGEVESKHLQGKVDVDEFKRKNFLDILERAGVPPPTK